MVTVLHSIKEKWMCPYDQLYDKSNCSQFTVKNRSFMGYFFFLNYIQNVHTKLYKVKYIAIDVY